jgi:hypothetical protein
LNPAGIETLCGVWVVLNPAEREQLAAIVAAPELQLINADVSEQIIRGEPDLQSVMTIAPAVRCP